MNMFKFLAVLFVTIAILRVDAQTYIKGPALIETPTIVTSAAGTTTLTKDSQTNEFVIGSTTQIVVLPDATTLPLGRAFYITNRSSGSVTINYNDGSLATTLIPDSQTRLIVRSIGTSVGTWDIATYPTSLANAWFTTGNAGTTAGTNFLGTTDATDLVLKTNSTEMMRIVNGVGYTFTPPADTSGATKFKITTPTEPGVLGSASDYMDFDFRNVTTFASNTAQTLSRGIVIRKPRYEHATSGGTIDEADTVYIAGNPNSLNGNTTITNSSTLRLTSTGSTNNITNGYGLWVDSPLGTNRYSGVFMGGTFGIGTTAPDSPLTINENAVNQQAAPIDTVLHVSGVDATVSRITNDAYGANASFTYRRANGTAAVPTALVTDDIIGALSWRGYGATAYSSAANAQLMASAAENWTDSAQGTYLAFNTTPLLSTTVTERMRILASGFVGIGNTAPQRELEISDATDPTLRLSEASSTTSYSELSDISATQSRWMRLSNSGVAQMSVDPMVTDGTSAASLELFRLTNTSGVNAFNLYRGNNSATVDAKLQSGTASVNSIAANGGTVGIGTNVAASKFQIAGSQSYPSWTTNGNIFNVVASTSTDTTGSGSIGSRVVNSIGIPTLDSTNAVTLSRAYSFFIAGAPVGAGNTTITSPFAFSVGGGNASFAGLTNFGSAISAAPSSVVMISGAQSAASWTTNGLLFNSLAATLTDTTGSGTVTNRVANSFGIPTNASSSAVTLSRAQNVYIAGAPIAGSNITQTSAWSLWVQGGASNFAGFNSFGGTTASAPPSIININTSQSAASWTTGGLNFSTTASTLTDTTGSGTIATRVAQSFGTPTFASSSAVTLTNAANFYISASPVAGANTTITKGWAQYIAAGDFYTAGNLAVMGTAAAPVSKIHVDGGNATASDIRLTVGSTTGQTSTDGVSLGTTTAGAVELRNYENTATTFYTNNAQRLTLSGAGNVSLSGAALSTSATDGFLYLPTSAGIPAGTPTSITGGSAVDVDTTNGSLYFYSGGWKKVSGATAPQVTVYNGGSSGTYSTPVGTLYLKVRMVGPGGGAAGSALTANNNGGAGSNGSAATTFGSSILTANPGGGAGSGGTIGGTGGTATIAGGASGVALTGGQGGAAQYNNSTDYGHGGEGASTPFGGQGASGAANAAGVAAAANTGSGGGGASGNTISVSGGGGGAGGYVDAIITSPTATYAYAVGSGGAGGAAGTGGTVGGAGAGGIIEIIAYFQ